MTSCPEAMGWEFGDFEKDVRWDPTQGRASPAGGYGMWSTFVGSDSTVSIVKIVSLSLSSCQKTKVKKLINVLYLNNGELSVFRTSLHQYILQLGKTLNEFSGYNIKQSNREAPVMLDLWGMQSSSLLPLLSGPLCPGLVSLDRVLFIGQTKLFDI